MLLAVFVGKAALAQTARPCDATVIQTSTQVLVDGTTAGAADHAGGASCGWHGGGTGAPDAVYEYEAPVAGRYEIRTQRAGFEAYLYVRDTSCAPAQRELACAEAPSGGRDAALSLDLEGGQRIAVVVDGTRAQGGPFTLQIARREPDLVADEIDAPFATESGARIAVAAEIGNAGDGVAENVEVRLVFAADPQLKTIIKEAASCRFARLAPDEVARCTPEVPVGVPLLGSGEYYIGLLVDPDDEIAESHEDNNRTSQPVDISYAGTASQGGDTLKQAVFRASDGTVYQMLYVVGSPLSILGAIERYRVTTLAGSIAGAFSCNSPLGEQFQSVSAAGGVVPPSMQLHPLASISRTGLLEPPNGTSILFSSSFGGRLTIGEGAGAPQICASAADCRDMPGVVPLYSFGSSAGGIPAACLTNALFPNCAAGTEFNAFGFGLSLPGNPRACKSGTTSVNLSLCDPEPTDGIILEPGQAVVMIYKDGLEFDGFSVGFGAFGIDRDGFNPIGCRFGTVVSATARSVFAGGAPPPPTSTPTATASPTLPGNVPPTPTPTPSSTATPPPTRGPDASEPDDVIEQARDLACGSLRRQSLVPSADVDWVRLTIASPTRIALRARASFGGQPISLLLDADRRALAQSEFSFDPIRGEWDNGIFDRCLAAGSYLVRIGAFSEAAAYDLQLECQPCVAPPANDACEQARQISAPSVADLHTESANTELREPDSSRRDVWFRYTAPPGGQRVVADTADSTYDTILTVYTGACGALTRLPGGVNDDAPDLSPQSRVGPLTAAPGQTLVFQIAAIDDGGRLRFRLDTAEVARVRAGRVIDCTGDGAIDVRDVGAGVRVALGEGACAGDAVPELGDLVAAVRVSLGGKAVAAAARPCGAIELERLRSVTMSGTTAGAVDHVGGASCGWNGGGQGAPDTVFEYTAPADGDYDVAVEGATFPSMVYVRDDTCAATATELACDAGASGGTDAKLQVELRKDQRVAIAVDGRRNRGGAFSLRVQQQLPDLVVRNLTAPDTLRAGGRAPVSLEVVNIGTAPADPFSIKLLFRKSEPNGEILLDAVPCRTTEPLGIGATFACIPDRLVDVPDKQGSHFLVAVADANGERDELSEINNAASRSVQITAPLISPGVGVGLQQDVMRASDGTVYQLLRVPALGQGAEAVRVTTIAASVAGVSACESGGGQSGQPVSTIAGVLPPGAQLHPYGQILRSAVVVPNDITAISFDAAFGGRVSLGSGANALSFCQQAFDCAGQANSQPLVPLSASTARIRAACIAHGMAAECDGFLNRDALTFGLVANGDPPECTNPEQATVNTALCAPEPGDGFTLVPGEAVLLTYDSSIAFSAFQVGVGGFLISRDSQNPIGCQPNTIVGTQALSSSAPPPPPPPTSTAAASPTPTATRTTTATRTRRPSRTPTPATPPPMSPPPTATITRTPTPAPSADAFEPDDTLALAKPIACNGTRVQTLAPGADVDWLRLTLAAKSAVAIAVDPPVALALFTPAGDALAYKSGTLQRGCASDSLAAGTFYARVGPRPPDAPSSAGGGYAVSIFCTPCPP